MTALEQPYRDCWPSVYATALQILAGGAGGFSVAQRRPAPGEAGGQAPGEALRRRGGGAVAPAPADSRRGGREAGHEDRFCLTSAERRRAEPTCDLGRGARRSRPPQGGISPRRAVEPAVTSGNPEPAASRRSTGR